MARSKGSICSKEAKDYAIELETLTGLPAKQNLDYLRFLEMLMVYRVAEQVKAARDKDSVAMSATVEIPLIGDLIISKSIFHKKHTLTDEPSIHFEYEFRPSNAFKNGIYDAWFNDCTQLPREFADMYGQKLQDLYTQEELK